MNRKIFLTTFAFICMWSWPNNLFAQGLVLDGAYVTINGGTSASSVYVIVEQSSTNGIVRTGNGGHIYTQGQYDFVKWNSGTGTGNYVFPFGVAGTAADYIPFTFNKTTSGSSNITVSTWSTTPQNTLHPGISTAPAVHVMKGTGDSLTTALDRFWDIRTSAPATADITFSYRASENTTTSQTDQLKTQRWIGTSGNLWSHVAGPGNTGVASGIGTVGPVTAQTTFTPFVLVRAVAPLFQNTLIITSPSFSTLKKRLDGGYYKTSSNKLYFTYEGEYNNGDLNYKIFDQHRAEVPTSVLVRNYGDNRYTLDFSPPTTLIDGQYYTLEVTSEKNEIFLLKFKYIQEIIE